MNKYCIERGHYWKCRINSWVCENCRMYIKHDFNEWVMVKPDKWYGIEREVNKCVSQ